MTWWMDLIVYAVGWFTTAVAATRLHLFHPTGYCHGEDRMGGMGNNWHDRDYCRRYDKKECWRMDPEPSPADAVVGTALGLLWPIAAPFLGVYFAATLKGKPKGKRLSDLIADLEKEAGIDD